MAQARNSYERRASLAQRRHGLSIGQLPPTRLRINPHTLLSSVASFARGLLFPESVLRPVQQAHDVAPVSPQRQGSHNDAKTN